MLLSTWNCDKWGWVGMKVSLSKKIYYTGMVLMKCAPMGTQALVTVTNAIEEKIQYAGKM